MGCPGMLSFFQGGIGELNGLIWRVSLVDKIIKQRADGFEVVLFELVALFDLGRIYRLADPAGVVGFEIDLAEESPEGMSSDIFLSRGHRLASFRHRSHRIEKSEVVRN